MAQHPHEIRDPDGVQLRIIVCGETVFFTDKEGRTIKFSAQHIPEALELLQGAEKKYYRSPRGGLST